MAPETANGPSLLITPSNTTAAIHPTADSLRDAFLRAAACTPEGGFYQDQKTYGRPARTASRLTPTLFPQILGGRRSVRGSTS